MAESYLKQEKDEIIIRSSAADRQMLLSAAVYLLSYLHIDKHPFTSLNPTLVYLSLIHISEPTRRS